LIARLRADSRTLPILTLIVIVFGIIAAGNPTFAQAGTYAAIFAIAAIGLSLLMGNVNQISLGQAGFFGIGAYAVASLTTNWNLPAWLSWPLATLIGIVVATLVGLGLGFIALRFRGHYLAMATLAFGLICVGIFHETKFLGGAIGIEDIPYPRFGPLTISGYPAYWFAWILALGAALLTLNLLRGRSGRAFEAIRNDELAAEVLGVPTRRYKIFAFAYAGALAGLGGSIYAAFLGIVVPDAVSVPLSISLLLMVVLGGSGGVSGALIGAALIGFLDISGHQFENTREVAYGLLVILVVIMAPGGAFGLVRSRFKAAAATPATRHPELVEGQPQSHPATATPRAITMPTTSAAPLAVSHVTKRFGGLVAVNDVSFELTRGTLTSLIGPNGAGKTTLFNAISGIGRVSEGRVEIAGIDVTGLQPHRIAALGVGRTFQNARLFGEMTVLENVVAGAFRTERTSFAADLFALPSSRRAEREATERARETLARLGLESLASTLARDLAFGDRRRVELARATASDPWLLLVDEPAAGLNASERAALTADLLKLRDAGMTLLLIEHDMRLVMSISERVMVLKFGTMIADGKADAVRNDPGVVAAYLGTAG
jgi:ABC-type branched-subunit amino acid transport system ATPase component/ABC-type branched-subunit amino acid transport system permease subunit